MSPMSRRERRLSAITSTGCFRFHGSKRSKIRKDLGACRIGLARTIEHYALDKVKERIIEYLAVQSAVPNKVKGSILCLVGPPGVGKTSLGKSIAQARPGRNFVRMSLGGVRDEAEIRGHRRTYIGSMPGKIIQGMKQGEELPTRCSCWMKSTSWGPTGGAIRPPPCLRCWTPSRTRTFNDHYLEIDYDLSDVMFLCTANTLRMPQPLLDRMELIRLSGYTEDEKVEISQACT